jgi:hypothetical protein
MLDHFFSVRWNADAVGPPLQAVLAPFSVPSDSVDPGVLPVPNLPPLYSLLDNGSTGESRYELFYGDWRMTQGSEPEELLKYLFWHVGFEAGHRTGSYLLIHAGAVVAPSGNALIFPAASGSGKSTLVGALVRAGFGYLSDEVAALDPVSRRVYPFPKAVSLKRGSFDLFPDLDERSASFAAWDEWAVQPAQLRADCVSGPSCPGWIVCLRHEADAATELHRITPATAVLEMSRNAMNLRIYGARAVRLLADVAGEVHSYQLVFSDLSAAVETITGLVSAKSTVVVSST